MFKWRKTDRTNAPVRRTESSDASVKEEAPPSTQGLWNTLAMRPAPPPAQSSSPPAELLAQAGSEPGKPLDEKVRQPMEEKLGADLGGVRVHTGPASAAAAESIGARAYTIGSDIHLGAGALQSGSGS